MEDMIRIQGLAKHYDGFTLENIGFSVPAGSVVGLIGSNGAGKTTTLKIILGLTAADGGDVRLLGCDPRDSKTSTRSRRVSGIVLDTCAFPDVSKVADVGTLGRAAYATWDDGRFKSLCDEFGLEPRKTVKDLSRGMGMKLTLAFALSHRTRSCSFSTRRRRGLIPWPVTRCSIYCGASLRMKTTPYSSPRTSRATLRRSPMR